MAFSNPSVPAFPADLPTKTLERVSFAGLRNGNTTDAETLYAACARDGFFLLDLTDSEQGRKFIATVDAMFKLQEEFFKLDIDVKKQYVGERFLG
jgi:isopenicillin N synthase-like dioxygenase